VQYGALGLLLLGIALMIGEVFTPGVGALGIGGLMAFLAGSFFLFEPDGSSIRFGVSLPVIAGAAIAAAGLTFFVIGAAMKTRKRPALTGAEQIVGAQARVVEWRDGTGTVHLYGERWKARGDAALKDGDTVRVAGRDGLTLTVQRE
jgi:membrane-bound serine protease (ClpP class)